MTKTLTNKSNIMHKKRQEIAGYKEKKTSDHYRDWKCEVEVQPYDRYSNDYFFWFTLSIYIDYEENDKEEQVEVYKKEEVFMTFGLGSYFLATETTCNRTGKVLETEPLFLKIDTLIGMVEYAREIMREISKEEE